MKKSTKRALAALGLLAIVAWWRGGAIPCGALGCGNHASAAVPLAIVGGRSSPSP